jgi:hypothetical protein
MPVETLEQRVAHLEEMVQDIPDLLNIRFARVDRQLAEVREQLAHHAQRLTEIDRKLETALTEIRVLPEVLARVIKEDR